jgi:hypothetical protein
MDRPLCGRAGVLTSANALPAPAASAGRFSRRRPALWFRWRSNIFEPGVQQSIALLCGVGIGSVLGSGRSPRTRTVGDGVSEQAPPQVSSMETRDQMIGCSKTQFRSTGAGALPKEASVKGPRACANATRHRALQVHAATRLEPAYRGSPACGTRN